MASYVPVIKNGGAIFYIALDDYAVPGRFKSNPTLAAGDVQIVLDGGSANNLATLPAASPASSKYIKLTLSAGETNADNLTILFADQTSPPEWCDQIINIQTAARQIDDLATLAAQTVGQADLDDIQARLPAALVGGTRMDCSVGAMASGVITASAIAADAITDAKVAADVTIASVTGSVGSVTGNVGGNVVGSVGSVSGAVGSVAANGITASSLDSSAGIEIADALLDRDMALGTDTGVASGAGSRTMRQALRFLRNKWSISGVTMTVTKEDDSAPSWSATVIGTAGADPITSVDPS